MPLQWFYFDTLNSDYTVFSVKPNGIMESHVINGHVIKSSSTEWDLVLEVEVEQREVFVNVYPFRRDIDGGVFGAYYDTLDAANGNKSIGPDLRYVLKITATEGEKPTAEFIE